MVDHLDFLDLIVILCFLFLRLLHWRVRLLEAAGLVLFPGEAVQIDGHDQGDFALLALLVAEFLKALHLRIS
jgi:hypothetical protein